MKLRGDRLILKTAKECGSRAFQARIPKGLRAASCSHSVRLQAVMQIAPSRALAAYAAIFAMAWRDINISR